MKYRAFRSFCVERRRDRLRLERCLVVGAISEVNQPLGFLEREPSRIHATCGFMAGVGRGSRVAPPQLVRKLGKRDDSGPPAVADAGELAVPLLERQPDLEENLRVARRCNHARDPAERRQVRDRVGRAGGRERAGRHRLSGGNRRVGQPLFGQTCARGARRRLSRRAHAEGAKGQGQQDDRSGRRSHDSTSVGVGSVCAGRSRAHGIKTRKGAPSCSHGAAIDAGGSLRGKQGASASQRWRPLGEMCDLEGCGSVMYEGGDAGSIRRGQRHPGRTCA